MNDETRPSLRTIRRIKGQLIRISALYYDDEGDVTGISGALIDPAPGEGRWVAIDMRGIEWSDVPVWLN